MNATSASHSISILLRPFIAALIILISSLSLAFAALARAQCGGTTPAAGDFRSAAGGSWNTAATWEMFDGAAWTAAASVPGAATTAQTSICTPHTVSVPGSTTVILGGSLAIEAGATISPGNSASRLDFEGGSLVNDGAFNVILDFQKVGLQLWSGSGTYASTISVLADAMVRLASDVSLNADTRTFSIAAGGTLDLNGFVLTQVGPTNTTATRLFSNSGAVQNGTIHFSQRNTIRPTAVSGSVFAANVRVLDEATLAQTGTVGGSVVVDPAATLFVHGSNVLTVQDNVTIDGTLSGGNSASRFVANGSFMTNGGSITVSHVNFGGGTFTNGANIANTSVNFNASGVQVLQGSGTMATGLNVLSGSTTRLMSDIQVGSSPSTSAVSTGGVLDLNGFTLTHVGRTNTTSTRQFSNSGTVQNGTIHFSQRNTLSPSAASGSAFSANVRILDEATLANTGTIGGSVIVDAGATLFVHGSNILTVGDDVTISGTLSGGNSASRFAGDGSFMTNNGAITISHVDFGGGTFTNIGTISSSSLNFDGLGVQVLEGSGTIAAGLNIHGGSTTRLTSNILVGSSGSTSAVSSGGVLDLNGFTLTHDGLTNTTATRLFSNSGTVQNGNIHFSRRNTLSPTAASGSVFAANVRVLDEATLAHTGTVGGSVVVDPGATLFVHGSSVLTVEGDVTIDGTLSGGNSASRFVADGPFMTNNGSITVSHVDFGGGTFTNGSSIANASVNFDGTGVQILQGAGSMATGLNVGAASTTRLMSDVLVGSSGSTSSVGSGGTLDLNGFTLTHVGLSNTTATRQFSNAGTVQNGSIHFRQRNTLSPAAASGSIFDANVRILDGSTFANAGTIGRSVVVDAGAILFVNGSVALTVEDNVSIDGTLSGGNSASRFIFRGSSLSNAGSVTIANLDFGGATQTLSGAGSWIGGTLAFLGGSTTTLGSSVTVSSSAMHVRDGATLYLGGHSLTTSASSFITGPTGTLAGAGTFDYGAGSLSHTGTISPGTSPGIIELVGPFSNAPGTLNIDVDNSTTPGTGHDQLAITGTGAHGGTLNVDFGYVPNLGDEFTILTCSSGCTGAFGTVNLPPDYSVDQIYNPNETILRITGVPNAFPAVNNPIADQSMNIGGPAKSFDLNTVFVDGDGDALTYTVASSSPGVVGAALAGSTLTITALAAGSSTITATADDGKGGTVQDVFEVTVNTPPTVDSPIADQNTTAGDPPLTFDLTTIFSDADGDPLTFSATSTNPAVVTAVLSGTTLTVTSLAPGTATITLTADDGRGGTAQDAFVVAVNGAPIVANPIADQTLTLGNPPFSRNLTTVFSDPDGDPLTFAATSSDNAVAGVSVSGNVLTVTQLVAGTATITVTADDGNDGSVQDVFDVTVNTPPTVDTPIVDQVVTAGASQLTFDLSTVFSDADGDALTYSASTTDAGVAGATISGSLLTVTPVTPGTVTVTVTANDGRGGSAQDVFEVDVNGPPVVVNPIADRLVNVGHAPLTFDVSTVFTDDDPLTFSATTSDGTVATADVSGTTLTVTPLAAGSASITVTADDGQGGTADDIFTITVNTPPTVDSPITDQNTTSGDPALNFDLDLVFSDADGDALSFSAVSSNGAVAGESISGSTLTVTSNGGGTATITVTANDGRGGSVQDAFTISVNARPAIVNAISDRFMNVGDAPLSFDLDAVFDDADGDALTYTAASSNAAVAGVAISGTTLTITAAAAGAATITVTADDGKGGTVEHAFDVTVNTPPTLDNPVADQNATVGDPPLTFDLNTIFFDADGDELTFSSGTSDAAIATATIAGSLLSINAVDGGIATISVEADDGKGGTATDAFDVDVNRPPMLVSPINDQQANAGDPPFVVDLNTVFSDPDGDAMTYASASSDLAVATTNVSGTTLTVTTVGTGITTITITADDGRGGTGDDAYILTANTPPTLLEPIADQHMIVGDTPRTFDLSTLFSDDNPLTFTASSSDFGIATALVSGTILTIGAVAGGTATITVTADDGNGGIAIDMFDAVVNTPPSVLAPIANQAMTIADPPRTFDLNTVFADPDGDPLAFTITNTNSSAVSSSLSGSQLTVDALALGSATITVTANDGRSGSAEDAFDVTIGNSAPIADAGPDQTVECGGHADTDVALDGSASNDPDGGTLNYTWTDADGNVVATGPTPAITLGLGTHILTLTVEDASGATHRDDVSITVRDTTAPVIVLNGDDLITLQCLAPYVELGSEVSDACDESPTLTITGTVDHITPGTYVVTYTATDASGNSSTAPRTVDVLATAPPNLVVTPAAFDFGIIDVGQASAPQSFVVENTGGCPLVLTAAALGGPDASDFSLGSLPAFPHTLASSEQITLDAAFTPLASGPRTAAIQLDSTDPDAAQTFVPLDGEGADPIPPLLHPYLLLADDKIDVAGLNTSRGDYHSNGQIHLKKGNPSTYEGNMTAAEKIRVEKDITIDGDVAAPDVKVEKNTTVTGTLTKGFVAPGSLPVLSYSAGGADVKVAPGGTQQLAPGSYGTVRVEKNGTLELLHDGQSGAYFFEKLILDKDTHLMIAAAGGPVSVNVVESMRFAKDVRIDVDVSPASRFITFNSRGNIEVDKDAVVFGSLVAPGGMVKIATNARFQGSIAARKIDVEMDAVLLHHDEDAGQLLAVVEAPAPEATAFNKTLNLADEPAIEVPTEYSLGQNYPNPFNPLTTIGFGLPEAATVRIVVYNALGRQVAVIADESMPAGVHEVQFDAARWPSGVYFYRLSTPGFTESRRMTVLK